MHACVCVWMGARVHVYVGVCVRLRYFGLRRAQGVNDEIEEHGLLGRVCVRMR